MFSFDTVFSDDPTRAIVMTMSGGASGVLCGYVDVEVGSLVTVSVRIHRISDGGPDVWEASVSVDCDPTDPLRDVRDVEIPDPRMLLSRDVEEIVTEWWTSLGCWVRCVDRASEWSRREASGQVAGFLDAIYEPGVSASVG